MKDRKFAYIVQMYIINYKSEYNFCLGMEGLDWFGGFSPNDKAGVIVKDTLFPTLVENHFSLEI